MSNVKATPPPACITSDLWRTRNEISKYAEELWMRGCRFVPEFHFLHDAKWRGWESCDWCCEFVEANRLSSIWIRREIHYVISDDSEILPYKLQLSSSFSIASIKGKGQADLMQGMRGLHFPEEKQNEKRVCERICESCVFYLRQSFEFQQSAKSVIDDEFIGTLSTPLTRMIAEFI